MKVSSIDKSIADILKAHYFKIPRFQRPYSWDKENIEEFWNDVVTDNSKEYFIGSMVVYKIDDDTMGLVDGQQRLTTITMMLSSIREGFKFINEIQLSKGVQGLIERLDLNNENQFILQTETSYPYFHEFVQQYETEEDEVNTIKDEEKRIAKAYEFLHEKIMKELESFEISSTVRDDKKHDKKKEFLIDIRNKVLNLKLIFIDLDNEEDAYIVFETLNTRGKNLRVSDLVKNHLTKILKRGNKQLDRAKDKWTQCVETIELSNADLNIDTFLLHFWLSKYTYTSMPKLFKLIRKEIDKGNAKDFLNDLISDSKTYRDILEPNYRNWDKQESDLKEAVFAFNMFRIKQQVPFLLAVMREYREKKLPLKKIKGIIKSVENFHLIFTAITSSRSSGGISTMYASHGRRLGEASSVEEKMDTLNELQEKLRSKAPTLEEFKASFREVEYTSKNTKQRKLIHYILRRVHNEFNRPKNSGVNPDFDKMTIEHLTPDSSSHDDVKGMVGNMILVSQELNIKLGNKSFKAKKELIKKSNISSDHIFESSVNWTKNRIEERTDLIAELCYNKLFKI